MFDFKCMYSVFLSLITFSFQSAKLSHVDQFKLDDEVWIRVNIVMNGNF